MGIKYLNTTHNMNCVYVTVLLFYVWNVTTSGRDVNIPNEDYWCLKEFLSRWNAHKRDGKNVTGL